MPNIGEAISTNSMGGKISTQKRLYMWMACPYCGRERWVRKYYDGKPMTGCCIGCGNKHGQKRKASGKEHGKWTGGRKFKGPYVHIWLPEDDKFYPMTHSGGYIPEHRLVMAQHLRRCLRSWEMVHHINGIKTDNRLENLELLPKAEHMGLENTRRILRRLEAENKQLKEQLKAKLDRPALSRVLDEMAEADCAECTYDCPKDWKMLCPKERDQLIALMPDEEEIRKQLRAHWKQYAKDMDLGKFLLAIKSVIDGQVLKEGDR